MSEKLTRKEQEIWKRFVFLSDKDSIEETKTDTKETTEITKEATYFSYFATKISGGITGIYEYFANLIWRKNNISNIKSPKVIHKMICPIRNKENYNNYKLIPKKPPEVSFKAFTPLKI